MKAHLVSIMFWAADEWSDDDVVREFTGEICNDAQAEPGTPRPFIKSVTIAPDQVAVKAAIIFGETVE